MPELQLLNRGLTFIPTPRFGKKQKLQLEFDLQNYHRRIMLAAHFGNHPIKKNINSFVGPSLWTPPLETLSPKIKNLIHQDLKSFKKQQFMQDKQNISDEDWKTLHGLKRLKTIVIKPADKGSALVILSREQYIMEAERQLNDLNYYKKLEKPIFLASIPMVGKILESLKKKKYINSKQQQYLMGSGQPRERRFYLLPKIHKDPQTWTVPFKVPPGRPIVSDSGSETYHTAEYLEHFLNPLSNKHPSYIKDTFEFVKIIKKLKVPHDIFFFSMDVESLYTNIPIEAGIRCVQQAFEKNPDASRPDSELLELLRINLCRNDFIFNGKFYLQIKGTAMGKRFAPSYANIYMANWEEEVFKKCRQRPINYFRYLDDILGIWAGSREEFDEFLTILNSHDSSIKLKAEINEDTIQFLDTTVYKGPQFMETGKLDIKVYFKSTNTHALLYRDSFHPAHTFKGVIKAQLIRFWRICSRQEDFWRATKVLFKALLERGYTRTFLKQCLRTFQNKTKTKHDQIIPLITTYSSTSRKLNWAWKNNFGKILQPENIFSNIRTISAYRRNPNLRDWLVRAELTTLGWTKPLGQQKHFSKLTYIRGREKQLFKINGEFDLKTRNCVYCIICHSCQKKYVGETKNYLQERLKQHLANIKNRKKTEKPLVNHFLEHGILNLKMVGLEKNINWSTGERRKRERYWIFVLGTREPQGLNVKKN